MTPPDTNLKKQKRRHSGPLIGIALVAVFALGVILYWIMEEVNDAPGPQDTDEPTAPFAAPDDAAEVPAVPPTDPIEPGDPETEVVR